MLCGVLAPHATEGYNAIPLWFNPTCGKSKAEHCCDVRKHMAELFRNAPFADSHGVLPSADMDSDTRRSGEMQDTLHAEAPAPTRGSLSFHTFRSKWMFWECVENSTPPPPQM